MNKRVVLFIFVLFFLVVNIKISYAVSPICLTPYKLGLADDKAYPTGIVGVNLGNFMGVVKIKGLKNDMLTSTPLTILTPTSQNIAYAAYLNIKSVGTFEQDTFTFPSSDWKRPGTYHTKDGWRTKIINGSILINVNEKTTNIQGIYYTPYRPPTPDPVRYAQVCFYPTYLDRDLDGHPSCDYSPTDPNCDCNDNNKKVYPGAPEICGSGIDSNCDGDIDKLCECTTEDTRSCYTGPTGTEGVGICKAGTQTCTNGKWGNCIGEVLPTNEICDGNDNNCDGNIDEGFNIGQSCSSGDGGCATLGVYVCNADKTGSECNAVSGTSLVEGPSNQGSCNNKIDDNCNGLTDCLDPACNSDASCSCNQFTDPTNCRNGNCYWSFGTRKCYDCSDTLSCYSFDNQDDCQANKCGITGCVWDGTYCNTPTCVSGNSDTDNICDGTETDTSISNDNCKYVNNNDQVDCDGNHIGDACDPNCIQPGPDNPESTCTPTSCGCLDKNGDGICDVFPSDETKTCDELYGTICLSDLSCIGGYMINSKDSTKCCVLGNCGTIEVFLSGQTVYTLHESDCRNPNDEGVGKKLVYKYDTKTGALIEPPKEEDCTVLPDKTVPFYSLISLTITLLVLVGFYTFRRKIFGYFTKKNNTRRNKN